MEDTALVIVRDEVIRLVQECVDVDLLDLVCKLLLESGVLNAGIIP